jgi:hypothetical protein
MTSHTIPAPRASTDLLAVLQELGTVHAQTERALAREIRELRRRDELRGWDGAPEQAVATALGWDVEQVNALLRRVARREHPAGKKGVRRRPLTDKQLTCQRPVR